MKRVRAKFVTNVSNAKQSPMFGLSVQVKTCSFLRTLWQVTSLGSNGYDPETKQQSSQWKDPTSPRPKKGRQVRGKTMVMLLAFFVSEGIIHLEFAPDGQTINKEFYVEVLWRLRESVRRKQPEKWRLDPPPRQCGRTHFTSCAAVFGQTQHRSVAAATILTRSRTVWLFSIPKA